MRRTILLLSGAAMLLGGSLAWAQNVAPARQPQADQASAGAHESTTGPSAQAPPGAWQLFVGLFTDLRKTLASIVNSYHAWTYAILFAIIFCETGFVVTPFLPGDSLLFAVGALAAGGGSGLDPLVLFVLLSAAAILGDTGNYWIGHKIGPSIFHKENVRFLNKEHLMRAHRFYEKHGGKTIILARFMPFIRTFAPFVAGIGSMTYGRFLMFNVVGGMAWIALLMFGGYYFGKHPWVDKHFELVVLAIIIISVTPPAIEYLRHRRRKA